MWNSKYDRLLGCWKLGRRRRTPNMTDFWVIGNEGGDAELQIRSTLGLFKTREATLNYEEDRLFGCWKQGGNDVELQRRWPFGCWKRVRLSWTTKKGTWGDDVGNERDLAELRRRQLGGWRWKRVNLAELQRRQLGGMTLEKSEAYPNWEECNSRGWSWKREKLSRTMKKATWGDDIGK